MTVEDIVQESAQKIVEVTIEDSEEDGVEESGEEIQRTVSSGKCEAWMRLCIVEESLELVECGGQYGGECGVECG